MVRAGDSQLLMWRVNKYLFYRLLLHVPIIFDDFFVYWIPQHLPAGNELVACLGTFKDLASTAIGQSTLLDTYLFIRSSSNNENQPGRSQESYQFYNRLIDAEWKGCPLLTCWINLYGSVETEGLSTCSVEAIGLLSIGVLRFCMSGRRWISLLIFISSHISQTFRTVEIQLYCK